MFRSAVFALLLASFLRPAAATAQRPASSPPAQVPAAGDEQSLAQQVQDAEAAIGKSDWKSAESILTPWVAAHPGDARALFDAGYVADAQNHTDQAIGLYRRATEANPKSFEAHLSLGLLLAREGKFEDARSELATATT
ncbi:MAG TPA: tetratricopeptide repeat protein, partial [Terracidiphilus sp.]